MNEPGAPGFPAGPDFQGWRPVGLMSPGVAMRGGSRLRAPGKNRAFCRRQLCRVSKKRRRRLFSNGLVDQMRAALVGPGLLVGYGECVEIRGRGLRIVDPL